MYRTCMGSALGIRQHPLGALTVLAILPYEVFSAGTHKAEKFKQVTVDDNPAGIRWIKLVI